MCLIEAAWVGHQTKHLDGLVCDTRTIKSETHIDKHMWSWHCKFHMCIQIMLCWDVCVSSAQINIHQQHQIGITDNHCMLDVAHWQHNPAKQHKWSMYHISRHVWHVCVIQDKLSTSTAWYGFDMLTFADKLISKDSQTNLNTHNNAVRTNMWHGHMWWITWHWRANISDMWSLPMVCMRVAGPTQSGHWGIWSPCTLADVADCAEHINI